MKHRACAWWTGLALCLGAAPTALCAEYPGTPQDYLWWLPKLRAGDVLRLAPGIYTRGLPIRSVNGEPGRPIVIQGPDRGDPAVLVALPGANTVSIVDSSHVVIRNLRLEGRGLPVDAVKAEGTSRFAHHITLAGLAIRGYGHDQSIVGISSQCPAWGWVIRDNVIIGAGTGMYLGGSDGGAPFVGGLIERNLVLDTLGYNAQIKHQRVRAPVPGMPTDPMRTIIRHNVFSKANNASVGELARPNLLIGHLPPGGPGSTDEYLVYGNFFHQNPVEALFQGEGNVAFYNNVLVNPAGSAVHLQPHHDRPKRIRFFHNTIVARDVGVKLEGASEQFQQVVARNVVFAAQPLVGRDDGGNLVGPLEAAAKHLKAPYALPGAGLDLSLRTFGGGAGVQADFADLPDSDRDFDGRPRAKQYVGAYGSREQTVAWPLALRPKPASAPPPPGTSKRAVGG